MADLPTGTVTFLFTDIEGSTRLWEQHAAAMLAATARHDALVEAIVGDHAGVLVRPRGEGDSRFAVFARASDAVAVAVALQVALQAERWPIPGLLRVRVALHTGEADLREGDYYGAAVNRCARLRSIAHGGQVLVSRTTHDLVRGALPDGVNLVDLGEHRLADLIVPERVFQATHPALPFDFPPLKSLDAYPHNLPLQLTSFVGRAPEIAEVARLLDAGRLVTLTGTGGCGKTRLALQVVADRLDLHTDGVWLVELAPLADAAVVPDAVATAVGARGGLGQPIQATLLSYLRARQLLVILDNCEHLLDACARLVDVILRSCPGVRILVTSREALGIAGEVSWRVPSLALPPADCSDFDEAAANESVRLFSDRAAAVQSAFGLTARNAAVVAQICRRLDGIPLAIELAASRARALSVEQIAARLDQRFRLLTGGSRTALPRQQTLAALVGWSYDLLSEPERTLFNRLSVFAGGFTLEAAEAVCSNEGIGCRVSGVGRTTTSFVLPTPDTRHPIPSEDVLDLLTGLVDKSLVVAETGEGAANRYRLLETLRQYGRERLVAAGEAEAIQRRHAAYYRDLVLDAEAHMHRPEQLAYLARLDLERDNLRAALRCYLDGEEAADGLQLARAMQWYWWFRGLMVESYTWCVQFLRLSDAASSSPARARTLAWAGFAAVMRGDLDQGRRMHVEALAAAGDTGDDFTIAFVMYFASNYGGPEQVQWYGVDARGLAEGALAHFRAAGDRWGISASLSTLGRLSLARGDVGEARRLLAESLAVGRTLGDRQSIAFALEILGEAIAATDEREAAADLGESLRLYREAGDLAGVASVENFLGWLDCLRGSYASGREHFWASLRITRDWEWIQRITQALAGLAFVASRHGQPERALRLGAAASRLGTKAGIERPSHEQSRLDSAMASAREILREGADVVASGGEAMTLEQAVAYALDEEDS